MDAAHDHLVGMLSRLKLMAIRDQLDSLVDEAGRRELTIREALGLFCEREIARKDERRIEMSIGLARFPFVRDLAGFDFAAQPSIDKSQARELATGRFIANGEALLLLGPTESDSKCPSGYRPKEPRYFDADRRTAGVEYGERRRHA